jgi:hypothetical protein
MVPQLARAAAGVGYEQHVIRSAGLIVVAIGFGNAAYQELPSASPAAW